MFYACKHHYSTTFCNDIVTLYRFETKWERDNYVTQATCHEYMTDGNAKSERVTRKDAVRLFPHAFKTIGEPFHTTSDSRDWLRDEKANYEYWTEENYYIGRGII